jgi:hypothetical protein
VPAIVLGAAVASIGDVRHRKMHKTERDFARRVFGEQIDYKRILITNMTHSGGQKFTMPYIGDIILVNLGDEAFDDPVAHREAANSKYPEAGSLFIHELTHAWQISHDSIVGLICGLSENYEYYQGDRLTDSSWQSRSWEGFNNEQQASIVDDWYGAHAPDLNSFRALNDPAFRFIRDNIRLGNNP